MKHLLQTTERLLTPLGDWLAGFRDERGRYRYRRESDKPHCLYATIDGVGLADLLGLDDDDARRGGLAFIRDCQSSRDGYFRCPVCPHWPDEPGPRCDEANRDGITFKAAATLFMAGSAPRCRLPEGNRFGDDLDRELHAVFQRQNPYPAGAEVWKRTGMHALKQLSEGVDPAGDPYVDAVLRWLIDHQETRSGFWFAGDDHINGMNGLLKMRYGTFDACGIAIPRATIVLDSILGIPDRNHGRFGDACADWNGAGLLADLGRTTPGYRDRILAVYKSVLPAVAAKHDERGGGLRMEPDHPEATLKSTFINAMCLLAMKWFVQGHDEGIDSLFFMKALRRRQLTG